MAQSFECSSCGAALDAPATYTTNVKCPYCGRDVIVPEELRPHPTTPPPQPEGLVINIKPPEAGQGRPEITLNVPQTPEFQRMEQVLMQRQTRTVRRAERGQEQRRWGEIDRRADHSRYLCVDQQLSIIRVE